MEAEPLVVVGTAPFGLVDRPLLQRRMDVAAGDLLRRRAELRQDLAGKIADTELQALEIADGLDLLAEPAAHRGTGVAARDRVDVVVLEELAPDLRGL